MDKYPDVLLKTIQLDVKEMMPNQADFLNGDLAVFARAEAVRRLGDDYLKKFERSNPAAELAAYLLFDEFNSRCREWALKLDTVEDQELWGTFLMLMDDFFAIDVGTDCELTWSAIADCARHGPGAAVGARGDSYYAKSSASPLTATSKFLIDLYEVTLCTQPFACTAESIRRSVYGAPSLVSGSRFAVVPKNDKIGRLICVEPTVNQFFQLGAGTVIEKRLKRLLNIDIRSQPDVNRNLSFLGSMGQRLATVDLKSASDSLSLGLMGQILSPEVFSTLVSLRSPLGSVKGQWRTLEMMSTMGNGFTFPLQTAIFSCAVLAALWCDTESNDAPGKRHLDRPRLRASGTDWSVFGDDIVIDAQAYPKLERLLKLMGCVVNPDKTFASGDFRESCGMDFYHGYNVRPVYLRRLNTRADFTVALNQLMSWASRVSVFPYHTFDALLRVYEKRFGKLNLVPLAENDDAGFKVPFALVMAPTKDPNSSYVYQARIARPRKYTVRTHGRVVGPRSSKSLIYNPDGLLRAFLLGEVRNGTIIAKCNGPLPYSTTECVTPNWDYVLPPSAEQGNRFVPVEFPHSWWGIAFILLDQHFMRAERHAAKVRSSKRAARKGQSSRTRKGRKTRR